MQLSANKIRAKLKTGEPAMGTMLFSWSPNVAEVAAQTGVDYVRVDAEHAWRQDSSLEDMVRAATGAGVDLMVRIDRDNPQLVRKALEIGCSAVLVANILTAAEAREIAEAGRFAPMGKRGFSGYCRSALWNGVTPADWIAWTNSEPMIGIMIEDPAALDEVDAMMAVDGIDFLNFGPNDYALNLGLPAPDTAHPDVQDGLRRSIAAARKAGKHAMCNVPAKPEAVARYREMGLDMFEMSNDLDYVRNGLVAARALVSK